MYECACSLQPGDDDPFFSCPIENWHLTADNMYETLKKGAMLYGFNEQRFAPHSLRIAGASAMRSVPSTYDCQQRRFNSQSQQYRAALCLTQTTSACGMQVST